jgi:hypothetical protein
MGKYVRLALTKAPKIVLKIGWRYLKVKRKARKAETIFRKRLLAGGMDPESAARLAEDYASTVSIRQIITTMGVPGKALDNGHP